MKTRIDKHNSIENLQPKLRFPEFKGEWVENLLGNIAKFSKGKGLSKSDIVEEGLNECIRYGELYTHYGETIKKIKSRTNLPISECVLSEENDIIIPASGETQIDIATASCVLIRGVILGGDLNIIKTNNNGVYMSYYLNNSRKEAIASLSQGISVVHLYSSQLATLKINLPTIPEQSKIASFLSTIDEKLNLLKDKKAAIEEYKKGMMQKIFSQEIRLKDENGKDFAEWEKNTLGDICDVNKGAQLNRDTLSDSGLFPCISGGIEPSGYALEYNRNENTIIISEGGNSCGYVNFITSKFWCGGHCYSIDIKDNSFDNFFLFQALKYYQDEIMKLRVGSGLPNIQKKDLLKFNLTLSIDLKEQSKIATFLSAIDEKIELVAQQIEDTQVYKRGLLQQMFC